MLAAEPERLPELPFLQLAVAGQHEDAARRAGQAVGQRHPLGLRDAHAERAGVGLDVRRLDVRMSRQPVQTAKLVELVGRQQAEPDQHRVERRRVVPLRREEDVARLVGPLSRSRSSLRNSQLMISSELKLVPMWPDQAPAIIYERVDARQRREGARALRRAIAGAASSRWNSETGT